MPRHVGPLRYQGFTPLTDHRFPLEFIMYSTSARQGRQIPDLYDLCDLYDLAHVGWEPYNLHNLRHVSWVGSVLHRSCTTSHTVRLGPIVI